MIPIDFRIEELADRYAAARDQLQAHPQFSDYATLQKIPPELQTFLEQYETARQGLLDEKIPVESIVPARRKIPVYYSSAERIALSDIVLYDAKGKPMRRYENLSLDGEAAKNESGNYLWKTQDEWLAHWHGRGRILPSLPLWYAIIEQLHERKHPGLAGIVGDLNAHCLATGTRLEYQINEVRHDYEESGEYVRLSCSLPLENHSLKYITTKKEWKDALQSLLLCKDVEKALSVLEKATGMLPHIWPASAKTRSSHPEMAVWLNAHHYGSLNLCCDYSLVISGRSRSAAQK